jgi:hypothetical protein
MKLYTFFRENEKVVYGTAVNGKSFFFFSGFNSAEEAKQAILKTKKGIEKIWFETSLIGTWSEIE